MAISDLMMEGVNLLVVGMGTVFVFLAVLVTAVSLMSKMAHRIEAMLPMQVDVHPPSAGGVPADHIAAIAAAVRRYRASRTS